LVTVPFVAVIVRANCLSAKVAVTLFAPVMVIEPGLVVPVKPPLHPVN
jgi:hypothetical protein